MDLCAPSINRPYLDLFSQPSLLLRCFLLVYCCRICARIGGVSISSAVKFVREVARLNGGLSLVNEDKLVRFVGVAMENNAVLFQDLTSEQFEGLGFGSSMNALFAHACSHAVEAYPTIKEGGGPHARQEREIIYKHMVQDTTCLFSMLLHSLRRRCDFEPVSMYVGRLYHSWEEAMNQEGFGLCIPSNMVSFLHDRPREEQVRWSMIASLSFSPFHGDISTRVSSY